MAMVDFHSHILPGIDDGSRDVAESLSMLSLLQEQGVDVVVATPHYYANRQSMEKFLRQRQEAYQILLGELGEQSPKILLGAEVRYYEGISRLENLSALCIGSTKLLLLEMPFAKWTEYTIRELEDLACSGGVQLVLAHIDRYLAFQTPDVWDRLLASGILMQLNAEVFDGFWSKRKALRLLSEQRAHLIGSDCHNLSSRAPEIHKAYNAIRNKFGEGFIHQMNDFARELLA